MILFSLTLAGFSFAQENKVPKNLIDKFFEGIKEAWKVALRIWKKMWQFFKKIWNSYIFPSLKYVWEKISGFFKNFWEKIKSFFKKRIGKESIILTVEFEKGK